MSRAASIKEPPEGGQDAPVVCAHCDLEVPPALVRGDRSLQFCCNGCEQVYGLLHDWGFDDYYRIRDAQDDSRRPATSSGRTFEDFDDPRFQDEYVEASERGTMCARLYLEGVHCAACVWLVEELPRNVEGLVATRLNLASSVATVEWDPSTTTLSQVSQALDSVGYVPHAHRSDETQQARQREDRSMAMRLGVAAACGMNIMLLHGALYAGAHHGMEPRFEAFFRWVSFVLAMPVILYSAKPFYRAAWAGLKQRVPHMDLPIALALTVAFGYSAATTLIGEGPVYFDSLAALVGLLLGARYLQRRAQRAALERANSLRDVAFAEYARRIEPLPADSAVSDSDSPGPLEVSREVPLAALKPGDRVEVRSGELVPVDGTVLRGSSSLNNAALTGEADPIAVEKGDQVHAGASNLGARLIVEVQAAGADTRVGALLALVEDALASRAPIVQAADRISRYFVVVVVALALLTGLLWIGTSAGVALEQMVALLVVTCPCALGLATPVAMSVGLMRAARAGIFVKNQDAVELLRRVDTILLDKTGTLTEGQATISRWAGADRALELAHEIEAESDHAVAQALRRAADRPMRVARSIAQVNELAGMGITGRVDDHEVAVGNRELMRRIDATLDEELASHASELVALGLSPLYVAVDGAVAAVGGVGDPLRPEAKATVAALQRKGVQPRIVSGDHQTVVTRIARQLGIAEEHAHGGLSPEDKRDYVAEMTKRRERNRQRGAEKDGARQRSGRVAMVGDGVNDAAAMALADVGISVHGGAGASIVAANVVLTRPGLAPLLEAVVGARRLVWVVYRNLLFSLAYNLLGAGLAIAGLVGPLLAAVLMPVSSLTVILSSVLARPFGSGRSRRRSPSASKPMQESASP